MRTEEQIREKLKQVEDAIKLEEGYQLKAPRDYYQMWAILKWVLGERDTLHYP
jgi:hypothetical protein